MAGLALPRSSPDADAARAAPQDAARRDGARGEILSGHAGLEARRQGARLSRRPRPRSPRRSCKFRIGYAHRRALRAEGASGQARASPVEDMVEAGLLIGGEDIPVPYDRFRDRVMFPITDLRSRVIAFGGRALEKDAQAKYLNSPETPLFHKGDTLYNIAAARQAAHDGATADRGRRLCRRHRHGDAGFAAAVAPLGTALTENQLALLWKMADEPILCFDGDRAGQKAAYRAADLALPHAQARQEPALRAAARRPGPRRSRALRRPRRDRGGDRGRASARRNDLARARSRAATSRRPSGARRWRRASASCRAVIARRGRAQILSRRI